jgi:hypothetical protein
VTFPLPPGSGRDTARIARHRVRSTARPSSPGLRRGLLVFGEPMVLQLSKCKFRAAATPVPVKIGHVTTQAKPKQSKTSGSLGWGLNQKVYMSVDGVTVYCQVNLSITVIGSKTAPERNPGDPGPDLAP